jgi:hypothetical protein
MFIGILLMATPAFFSVPLTSTCLTKKKKEKQKNHSAKSFSVSLILMSLQILQL